MSEKTRCCWCGDLPIYVDYHDNEWGRPVHDDNRLFEMLGKETIYLLNNSESRGNSPSFSQSQQKLGKELMSVDKLATMDGSRCILQLRGIRPFFSPKYDLKKHPNYKHTAEADKRNAFDPAKLINTRLRAKPDEQFTVYHADVSDEGIGKDEDILNYDDMDDPDGFA
jgi:type IV secretion system protein VirD4